MEEKSKKATQEGADLKTAAKKYGDDLSHDSCEQAFLDGAKWVIDKACEWLIYNADQYIESDDGYRIPVIDVRKMVDDFKKAMEEQQ